MERHFMAPENTNTVDLRKLIEIHPYFHYPWRIYYYYYTHHVSPQHHGWWRDGGSSVSSSYFICPQVPTCTSAATPPRAFEDTLNIYLCIAVFPISFHFQLLIVEQTLPDTTHTSKSANIRPLPRSKCPSSIDWQTRLVDMEAGILTPVAQ